MNPDWPDEMRIQFPCQPQLIYMGPLCYAESDDGIQWFRQELGQVLFKGSRKNNAISLPNSRVAAALVIKDEDDPDPSRRYKMVYNYYTNQQGASTAEQQGTFRCAVSSDGINWNAGERSPVDSFIEISGFYKFNGFYVVGGQKRPPFAFSEGGNDSGRQGYAHISYDFTHWLQEHAESFLLPEPANPKLRGTSGGYDQVHIGVAAFDCGGVMVGLYGLWHNADYADAFDEISCDLGLVVSNDGIHFREPVKGNIFLSAQECPVTPIPGRNYNTILTQGNGILNVGDETRIYFGRWRNTGLKKENIRDYYGEIALATLPRDRWCALGLFPGADRGSVWSAPILLPSNSFFMEINGIGTDGMTVELSDDRFNPITGFSGNDAGRVQGKEGLNCRVLWPHRQVRELSGKTVRILIQMKKTENADPRLFAVYLKTEKFID
jgi:hypothetical protein